MTEKKYLKGKRAIAIIDVPSSCDSCPFGRMYGSICAIGGDTHSNGDHIYEECPLILLPATLTIDEKFINQNWENTLGSFVMREDIKNMPTIDAIPVEWIENYAKENYPIWDRHAPIRAFYTNMIKVWRKENESNNL